MNEIIGFISIGGLIIIQLVAFAYGYGKLNEKVGALLDRLSTLEKVVFTNSARINDLSKNQARLEGKLEVKT